jgi:SAM-dependent methyltransferase
MTDAPESRSEKARAFYDATAGSSTDFVFMNYGYAAEGMPVADASEPERYCQQLYKHVVGHTPIAGKRLLEVSSGRGGGAAFMMTALRPARLAGVDISEQNVAIARKRAAGVPGLTFEVGRAEKLPFADGSFDAVINVEASHLYDDHAQFFAEVRRVLAPGGRFLYADLFWANNEPEKLITEAGLAITESEDITANVVRALDLDTDRRERIVTTGIPPDMQQDYRNWAGVKGFRAYNRFASREWVYRCIRAQRLEK